MSDIVPVDNSDRLIEIVLSKGGSIETLERVIALRNAEDERQSKRDFDINFALMQSKFKPIERSKKGDKGKYAPVDKLCKDYGPIITEHGFSFYWDEENLPDGSLKIILYISGYGHTKSNTKILPSYIPDTGSASGKPIMNVLQAEGTRTTYGQRYTFKNGFGITETDEDTDGNLSFSDGVMYAEQTKAIHECKTLKQLGEAWKLLYPTLTKDGKDVLTVIKDKKKAELVAEAGK